MYKYMCQNLDVAKYLYLSYIGTIIFEKYKIHDFSMTREWIKNFSIFQWQESYLVKEVLFWRMRDILYICHSLHLCANKNSINKNSMMNGCDYYNVAILDAAELRGHCSHLRYYFCMSFLCDKFPSTQAINITDRK